MLGAGNISRVLEALVGSGHIEAAQRFYGCCGPNWRRAYDSSSTRVRESLRECTHEDRVDLRVAVTVFNALAESGRADLVLMLCRSQIGGLGRIQRWCGPDAAALIRDARGRRKSGPVQGPQMGKFH